jgi:hypothetical protein
LIDLDWPDFKTKAVDGNLHIQEHCSESWGYELRAYDSNIIYSCIIDQEDATYYTDYTTNYQSLANAPITNRDSDGSVISRTKVTEDGWRYEPRCLNFYTSKLNSLYNRQDNGGGILDGTDYDDAGLKFYDSTDTELVQGGAETDADFQIRLTANCTKTIMWWQTTYDMDLIGGMLQLKATPTSDTYFWCVAAPDIPAANGGSVPFFASGLNLHFYQDGAMHLYDGRGVKRFLADPINNSNKFHFILKHPVGEQVGLQFVIDTFRA